MESAHPLKTLLQLQLASDSSAVLHLPYILASLTSEYFTSSSHLPKWTTRINSLLHSKDPGGRWAGLCLAYQTSVLTKPTMIENAHSWLGAALPMLSKNEPIPTLKAAVRLLRQIFTAATDVPEFQRQVATPNVLKFSTALVDLAGKPAELEFKIQLLTTLTRLIPQYPTLHRAPHLALSSLSLSFLNGTTLSPTNAALLGAASQLYAVLHFTGGKVGAANLWKKSVDDTLGFSRRALEGLRSTFPNEGHNRQQHSEASSDDPLIMIPLNLDRLRCGVVVLCDLLRSATYRSVQVPLGPLTNFASTLLSCTAEEKVDGHIEPAIRAMEISVIPAIWNLGCHLISCLAKCAQHHLTPCLTRLVSYFTFHLEQKLSSSHRLPFLQALQVVFSHCHPLHSPLVPTRLVKAVLPSLSIVLARESEIQYSDTTAVNSNKGRKGKKRARGYEGDEVFKVSREVIFPAENDGKVVLVSLEIMQLLLRNPNLAPPVHSLSSRVLLSILLVLPQMSPASLSPDPNLHGQLLGMVQTVCAGLGLGTTSVMSKSLGLVVRMTLTDSNNGDNDIQRDFDILLHPRVPPLVRSLPHVESLSLFRTEESQEEIDARESLGLENSSQESSALTTSADQSTEPPLPSPTQQHPPLLPSPTPRAQEVPSSAMKHQQRVPASPSPPPPPPPPIAAVQTVTLSTQSAPQPHSVVESLEDEDDDVPLIDMDSDSD